MKTVKLANRPSDKKPKSVRKILYISFAALVSFMLVVTGVSLYQVKTIDTSLEQAVGEAAVKQKAGIDMRGSVHDRAIAVRDLALLRTNDSPHIQRLQKEIEKLGNDYAAAWKAARETEGVQQETDVLKAIEAQESTVLAMMAQAEEQRLAHSYNLTNHVVTVMGPAFEEWLRLINVYIGLQNVAIESDIQIASEAASGFTVFMVIMTLLSAVTGIVIALLVTREIYRALGAEPSDIAHFAQEMGEGNLRPQLNKKNTNKAGSQGLHQVHSNSAGAHMLEMTARLRAIVEEVRVTASHVSELSDQVNIGNESLASRTNTQEAAVTQTATAVEELIHTIEQTTNTAQQAAEQSQQASDVAIRMQSSMESVRRTMDSINDGAKQISEITTLIDNIAFQTNILALNASVEAARAGGSGRGFAVVASEVRSLAQKSAEASSHISKLIDENLSYVRKGAELTQVADAQARNSLDTVTQMADLIQGISQASKEQSLGVSQIHDAVIQISKVAEHNARMVQDSTETANALAFAAKKLDERMQIFQV